MIMNSWFECKIKVEDPTLDKEAKSRIEGAYLVDALNFTEAEARIIKEITPFCNGMLKVKDIKRARYQEMFTSDAESADKWYSVKCAFIIPDEEKQTEKKVMVSILVQAADLREAISRLDEGMKGSMQDYDITTVTETKLIDVFPYATPDADSNATAEKPEYEQ